MDIIAFLLRMGLVAIGVVAVPALLIALIWAEDALARGLLALMRRSANHASHSRGRHR